LRIEDWKQVFSILNYQFGIDLFCFFVFTAADASGAEGRLPNPVSFPDPHRLEVGKESPFRFVVSVTDIVSYCGAFPAEIACP